MGTDSGRYAMSLPAIIDTDAFDQIKQVADLYAKGTTSPYAIARRLNIKVIEARQAIDTWHEIIQHDADSKDLARDALHVMLDRYDRLLVEAHENLSNLKDMAFDEKVSAQINATLKNIADWDAKRVSMLREAGLLDAHDLGDELAEREEREAMILGILKEDLCDSCRANTRHKLSILTGVIQGDVVEGEVIDE